MRIEKEGEITIRYPESIDDVETLIDDADRILVDVQFRHSVATVKTTKKDARNEILPAIDVDDLDGGGICAWYAESTTLFFG